MFATAAARCARAVPLVVCGSVASHPPSQCGWFGRGKSDSQRLEDEKRRLEEEVAALRARLGPLAALDLNGDGVVDAADAALALRMGREKAMGDGGGDALLRSIGERAAAAVETGVPSQLSWGFCSGYCAGFAGKKASKVVAVGVGGVFCLMQALAYHGYVVVDQEKISREFLALYDTNNDGKVDLADAEDLYAKALEVLSFNMPSGGGFAAGVAMGLRSG